MDGGQWWPDRVSLGVESSGWVVDGGQIDNVEQEGEGKRQKGALESLVEHGTRLVVKIRA